MHYSTSNMSVVRTNHLSSQQRLLPQQRHLLIDCWQGTSQWWHAWCFNMTWQTLPHQWPLHPTVIRRSCHWESLSYVGSRQDLMRHRVPEPTCFVRSRNIIDNWCASAKRHPSFPPARGAFQPWGSPKDNEMDLWNFPAVVSTTGEVFDNMPYNWCNCSFSLASCITNLPKCGLPLPWINQRRHCIVSSTDSRSSL